ncbi:hypothetical protein BCV70DRAFT_150677, partial [Testicularia cyperi]
MVVAPRQPRRITPTSPSPSPEPAPETASSTRGQAATSASRPTDGTGGTFSSALPTGSLSGSKLAADASVSPEEQIRANLESKVRSVVDLLYQLAVCAADVQDGSEHLVGRKINECVKALAELDQTKFNMSALIPMEVIEMLDVGKNPDIHTRNFVQRLASENQYSNGQHSAMKEYNDQLNAALDQAFPAL